MRCSVLLTLMAAGVPVAAGAASLDVTVVDRAGKPVRDAVVSVAPAGKAGAARFPFVPRMSQQNIQFSPGTLIVPVGTTVSFPNMDKVRHHVYSFSRAKKFELKLYGRDESRSVRFDQAGTIAVGCNIHDAMRGFIRVVDTPWATKSLASGRADFDGLPGGKMRVTVWHPQLRAKGNEISQWVELSGNGRLARTVRLP